ncbi:putative nucleotidyltransferase substrate binding domain-containing protein [Lacimicrobium alkaliphilum]|uniref:Cyclic nucleotide-binding protein n=1 Tax=Lacimicrobium alkaliphilum TaxID=1526571 RepID=A0ABQ1RFT2_9ALTE|nr:putative nucleotidyltransferase substrate binding domain-containing protein [Lacimicrobium alkaliphilum]GGD68808.1 cyclic nucleotide-binding protein [Lacimicrobium alkaliphilum]
MDSMDSTRTFLQRCVPFDRLSVAQLDYCLQHLQLHYVCEESLDEVIPKDRPQLYLIKKGVFDLLGNHNQLIERLEPGDLFGFPSLLTKRPITNRIKVLDDGLMFSLAQSPFDYLCQHNQEFSDYFSRALGDRLLTESRTQEHDWTQLSVADILERSLVSISADCSVADAALQMSENKVSCLLIQDNDELQGIITDRDIRSRVVAQRQSYEQPVRQFMTTPVIELDWQAPLFDAMQAMTSQNVHHIAVVRDSKPVGVITATDLMRQQRSEPLFLVNRIRKADTVDQLQAIAELVPEHLHQFAHRVVDVRLVGDLLASFTDAFNIRLIRLYQRQYGEAPFPFVWLTFGSQARRDQSLSSDQDNGLLLEQEPDAVQAQWFAGLAEFVCDGLARCGLELCGGNIMASNDQLRVSGQAWISKFRRWILEPDQDALMRTNIFFDHRALYGDQKLFEHFDQAVSKLATNQIFLANLAANSADLAVPIGLFNRFRTQKLDDEKEVIDIKKSGIAIINDIARIHSLASGIRDCGTPARLQRLKDTGAMNTHDAEDLLAAWRFLVQMRLTHQLNQKTPDNLIAPDQLDSLTRRQLKAAFRLIKDAQEGLALTFSRGAF